MKNSGHYDEEAADLLFLEYCDLGSLGSLKQRHEASNARFPESFVWYTLASLVKTLQACHTGSGKEGWNPIMHNDLHNGNILSLSSSTAHSGYPRVVLADFGESFQLLLKVRNGPNPRSLPSSYIACAL